LDGILYGFSVTFYGPDEADAIEQISLRSSWIDVGRDWCAVGDDLYRATHRVEHVLIRSFGEQSPRLRQLPATVEAIEQGWTRLCDLDGSNLPYDRANEPAPFAPPTNLERVGPGRTRESRERPQRAKRRSAR
jgi:hypothetical protein